MHEEEKATPLLTFLIPECCREGWDSCTHGVQRPKPKKKNIAL